MSRHSVRLVFADGDEGNFEVDDNGTSPQSTFETKSGKTYPLPETGCVTAAAHLRSLITRFCRDPDYGVPSVLTVHTDRKTAQSTLKHDAFCSGASGCDRYLAGVVFFAPDGPVAPQWGRVR